MKPNCYQVSQTSQSGVIVENTFTSIPAMGAVMFSIAAPLINVLPQFAIKNKYYRKFSALI